MVEFAAVNCAHDVTVLFSAISSEVKVRMCCRTCLMRIVLRMLAIIRAESRRFCSTR
jgi:hypothetical protein